MDYNEQKSQQSQDTEIIGLTALETLFRVVVIFPLLFLVWTLIFPASAAQFYYDIGNNLQAYIAYDRAVEKASGEEQVNLRIQCVNLALMLVDEGEEYNDEIIKHTEKFLFSDECLYRAVKIDDYALVSTAPILHPSIYGYADYLRECNAKARAKKGDFTVMVGKDYKTVEEVLSSVPNASSLLQLCSMLGVTAETGASAQLLCDYANTFLLNAVGEIDDEVTVENLYSLYAYGKMQQRLKEKFSGIENNLVVSVNYKNESYTHDQLYKLLIAQYVSSFQK